MLDVSVNGQWLCQELPVTLLSRTIPALPEAEENKIKLAGSDGELDFGSTYGTRIIRLSLFILDDYHRTVAKLAAIFNIRREKLEVRFSDIPGRRYVAQFRGTMDFDASSVNRQLDIPLKMYDPFPDSDERVEEVTITRVPEIIAIDSDGDVRANPIITLTNTGTNTIRSFKITNEYKI